jgi:hypothetical protein
MEEEIKGLSDDFLWKSVIEKDSYPSIPYQCPALDEAAVRRLGKRLEDFEAISLVFLLAKDAEQVILLTVCHHCFEDFFSSTSPKELINENLVTKVLTFFPQAYGICQKIESRTFVPASVDKTNAEYFLETLLLTAQKRSLRPGLINT